MGGVSCASRQGPTAGWFVKRYSRNNRDTDWVETKDGLHCLDMVAFCSAAPMKCGGSTVAGPTWKIQIKYSSNFSRAVVTGDFWVAFFVGGVQGKYVH